MPRRNRADADPSTKGTRHSTGPRAFLCRTTLYNNLSTGYIYKKTCEIKLIELGHNGKKEHAADHRKKHGNKLDKSWAQHDIDSIELAYFDY